MRRVAHDGHRSRPLHEKPGLAGHARCRKKTLGPSDVRELVRAAQSELRISQRRACVLAGLSRSTMRYQGGRQRDDSALKARLKELAAQRRRYGSPRLTVLSPQEAEDHREFQSWMPPFPTDSTDQKWFLIGYRLTFLLSLSTGGTSSGSVLAESKPAVLGEVVGGLGTGRVGGLANLQVSG